MDCKECKERLYPDDPSVPQWDPGRRRYLPPLCQHCSGYHPDNLGQLSELQSIRTELKAAFKAIADIKTFISKSLTEINKSPNNTVTLDSNTITNIINKQLHRRRPKDAL